VSLIGKPNKEIQIIFDSQKLWALNLDFSYIVSQLKSAFVKFPVNKKIVDGTLYAFEVVNYETNMTWLLQDITRYPVLSVQGKTIQVDDIADVYLGYANEEKKSFIITDVNAPQSKNALSFQIKKSPGYSLGPLVDAIKSELILI